MSTRPLQVLCIEPDPDIATIVALALALDGAIEPVVAPSCDEAVTLIGRGLHPALIVLDAGLAEEGGEEAIRLLRHGGDAPRTPVVLLSAGNRPVPAAVLTAQGVCGTIDRPFDPLWFAAEIEQFIARR